MLSCGPASTVCSVSPARRARPSAPTVRASPSSGDGGLTAWCHQHRDPALSCSLGFLVSSSQTSKANPRAQCTGFGLAQ